MTEPQQTLERSAPYRGALVAALCLGTWAAFVGLGIARDLLHHALFAVTTIAAAIAVTSTRRASDYRRRRMELQEVRDKLRVAEARYRSLVESIPAVIYIDAPGD